jgi:hypothetical protein
MAHTRTPLDFSRTLVDLDTQLFQSLAQDSLEGLRTCFFRK